MKDHIPNDAVVSFGNESGVFIYALPAPGGWPKGFLIIWKLGKLKHRHMKHVNTESEARREVELLIGGIHGTND